MEIKIFCYISNITNHQHVAIKWMREKLTQLTCLSKHTHMYITLTHTLTHTHTHKLKYTQAF